MTVLAKIKRGPAFLDEPYKPNPWTAHAKQDWRKCWPEWKYSVSHPREEFRRAMYGLWKKNPDLPSEWRTFALCVMAAGLLYLVGGIFFVLIGTGII